MADLLIDALEAAGVASSVLVTVELTDGRGDPVVGYVAATDQVIIYPSTATTDSLGQVTISLVPNEDIVPENTCYTVRIQDKQFLIQKSAVSQSLFDALVTDVPPLTPIETNDLLAHINNPFNAHFASAIGVTPEGTIEAVNVQDALVEVAEDAVTDLATHVDNPVDAHDASAVSIVPFATIAATDVQAALEELFTEASGVSDAIDVTFTPAGTVSSTNVQDAIEEVSGDVTQVATDLAALQTEVDADEAALAAHLADTVDAHDAIAISFVPAGDIASDNVQMAIEEVAIDAAGYLAAHVNDTTDAHDASAVSFVPTGTIAATDAQAAIAEVATDAAADTATVASDLAAHLADAVDAHDASAVSFVPASGIAATDAQAAIVEAKTDAQTYSDTNLATHTSNPTGAHAATAISFAPTGDIAATTVQAAIVELNAETADLNDPRIVRSDAAFTDAGELIGFPDRTASTLTMVNAGATYTINLTPVSSSFTVWAGAQKYVKSSVESVSMPKTSGLRYVYYNSSGTLTQTTFKWNWNTDAPVGVYYYSVAAGAAFFIDERHGVNMDNDTQQWLSEVAGSRIVSGIVMGNYTLAPSSPVDADNKFSTTAGLIVDADIQYTIPAVAAGGGAGLYGIFSRSGTTEWTVAASAVPVSVGTNYPKWNQNVAGTWQLTEASNGDFMNMWLLAVPTPLNGLRSYVLVPGEAVYANIADALAESETTSPLLASFPFREAISHYRITIQCGNAYGSTGKFRIRQVSLLAGRSITTVASTETTDHAILLNRTMSDQHPASAITFTPVGTIAATDTQTAVAEVATDAATALTGHTGLGTGAHAATAVSFSPTGTIAATNAQTAIAEVATDAATALTGHTAQVTGAHAASAISVTPFSTIAATDLQAALQEVYNEAPGSGGTPAASAVTFSPTGDVAATNVQTAIAEVDSEKVPKLGNYAATSTNVVSSKLAADTVYRWAVSADGFHTWGAGGVSAGDVTIGRSSTGTFQVSATTVSLLGQVVSGNGYYFNSTSGLSMRAASGSPESAITAPVGSQFFRTDGSGPTAFYFKASGSGNTGWKGVQAATTVSTGTPSGTPGLGDLWVDTDDVAPAYIASNVTNTAPAHMTATNVQAALTALPKGLVSSLIVTSPASTSLSASTSPVSGFTAPAFTVDTSRAYRINWSATVGTTGGSGVTQFLIQFVSGGTTLTAMNFILPAGTAGQTALPVWQTLWLPSAGTYTFQTNVLITAGGTPNLTIYCAAANPWSFWIEDIGAR